MTSSVTISSPSSSSLQSLIPEPAKTEKANPLKIFVDWYLEKRSLTVEEQERLEDSKERIFDVFEKYLFPSEEGATVLIKKELRAQIAQDLKDKELAGSCTCTAIAKKVRTLFENHFDLCVQEFHENKVKAKDEREKSERRKRLFTNVLTVAAMTTIFLAKRASVGVGSGTIRLSELAKADQFVRPDSVVQDPLTVAIKTVGQVAISQVTGVAGKVFLRAKRMLTSSSESLGVEKELSAKESDDLEKGKAQEKPPESKVSVEKEKAPPRTKRGREKVEAPVQKKLKKKTKNTTTSD